MCEVGACIVAGPGRAGPAQQLRQVRCLWCAHTVPEAGPRLNGFLAPLARPVQKTLDRVADFAIQHINNGIDGLPLIFQILQLNTHYHRTVAGAFGKDQQKRLENR